MAAYGKCFPPIQCVHFSKGGATMSSNLSLGFKSVVFNFCRFKASLRKYQLLIFTRSEYSAPEKILHSRMCPAVLYVSDIEFLFEIFAFRLWLVCTPDSIKIVSPLKGSWGSWLRITIHLNRWRILSSSFSLCAFPKCMTYSQTILLYVLWHILWGVLFLNMCLW